MAAGGFSAHPTYFACCVGFLAVPHEKKDYDDSEVRWAGSAIKHAAEKKAPDARNEKIQRGPDSRRRSIFGPGLVWAAGGAGGSYRGKKTFSAELNPRRRDG